MALLPRIASFDDQMEHAKQDVGEPQREVGRMQEDAFR